MNQKHSELIQEIKYIRKDLYASGYHPRTIQKIIHQTVGRDAWETGDEAELNLLKNKLEEYCSFARKCLETP